MEIESYPLLCVRLPEYDFRASHSKHGQNAIVSDSALLYPVPDLVCIEPRHSRQVQDALEVHGNINPRGLLRTLLIPKVSSTSERVSPETKNPPVGFR